MSDEVCFDASCLLALFSLFILLWPPNYGILMRAACYTYHVLLVHGYHFTAS